MLVYCDKKTQKPSLCIGLRVQKEVTVEARRTCSCSKNSCRPTYVIWHKKAHEIILRYPTVVGSCMRTRTSYTIAWRLRAVQNIWNAARCLIGQRQCIFVVQH